MHHLNASADKPTSACHLARKPNHSNQPKSLLLSHTNKNNQHKNQDSNNDQAPMLLGGLDDAVEPPPRAIQRPLMPVHALVHLVEHQRVLVELVADRDGDVALPRDRLAQPVQLRVLVAQHRLVVLVDLRVAEVGLVWRWRLRLLVRVVCVPCWEERRPVGVVGVVGEAHGFGGLGLLRVVEVGG